MIEYRTFFGDGEKTFAFPTCELIEELERITGHGIGALHWRLANEQFSFKDALQVIRLGLIGGGLAPREAERLVTLYCVGRPWRESHFVALGILNTVFYGAPETEETDDDFGFPQDDIRHAAATGDLSAAINAAYSDVAA